MSVTRIVSRLRWAPLSLVAGVVAAGAVALSMTGTLAAFTASITHNRNAVNTGTLTMQLQNSALTATCTSTGGAANGIDGNANATCSGINHYGDTNFVPGANIITSVYVKNTGTVTANSFTIAFGSCSIGVNPGANNIAGNATDLCPNVRMSVTALINSSSTVIFDWQDR